MWTLNSSSCLPTLGVLDLGGSSLQVVMEIKELTDDRNLLQLKFGSVQHQILAYSLPRFPVTYNIPTSNNIAAATHSKNFDWSRLTEGENCKGRSSSSNSTYSNLMSVPHPVSRFHALPGFFAIYSMLELNPRANLAKIWKKGEQICSGSWIDSKKISGNRKYADQFCFRVPYLASLLEDTLCLGDAEINFGPGDVSWTLGAALVEGEHKWLSNKEPQAGSYNLKLTEYEDNA
ncbi:hypothetical protein MKW92_019737 [Papaver armeniacum]|nr:hypothetical protein MKW92_019737 [Papaver armeniacum]